MNALIENIQALVKALDAGQATGAPGSQANGSALHVEDLSPVIQNVCWTEDALKLQKVLKVESCKSTLAQFDRQLSYGNFGGSAQFEGAVGMPEDTDIVRVVVPMCFYSHTRRTTLVSNLIETVDGKKAEEREAESAAKKVAGDTEFDIFRGKADFSNGGVFDGNPLAIPNMPNIVGLDVQIRQSDYQSNSRDLMMEEYGSNLSIVIPVGGVLSQSAIEDGHVRSMMNNGEAKKLYVDPLAASAYNKTLIGAVNGAFAPIAQRLVLGGSAQDVSGADLRRQFVWGGSPVEIEASRFLSGKTTWAKTRPQAPGSTTFTSASGSAGTGTAEAGTYHYVVTACNGAGESTPSPIVTHTMEAGKAAVLTIAAPGSGAAAYFNVYRSKVGATKSYQGVRFIGRVAVGSGGGATFTDAGNRKPGSITGFLLQQDSAALAELAPYSRLKLAVHDLSQGEAHFRFLTLKVYTPRYNVLFDSVEGAL